MTSDELKSIMNEAIAILEDNKKIVTPEIIVEIEALLQAIKQLDNPSVDKAIVVVEIILSHEKRLINSNLTEKIVKFLTNLQQRPLIMKLIAALL